METIAVGSDHAGFQMKTNLIAHLQSKNYLVLDLGCNGQPCDYPVYARAVCQKILSGEATKGLLIDGTGIAMSMAANKFKGIRCAVLHDHYGAVMTRQHNNANVVSLGGRTTGIQVAKQILDTFLTTEFDCAHPNHSRRVDQLDLFNQAK